MKKKREEKNWAESYEAGHKRGPIQDIMRPQKGHQKGWRRDFPGGTVVKNLPAVTWVQSLVGEDPTCCRAAKSALHNY